MVFMLLWPYVINPCAFGCVHQSDANMLNQQSCLLAVGGVVGFVGELALLHQWDADAEEQSGHGNRSQNEPINAVQGSVHNPNAHNRYTTGGKTLQYGS